MEALEARLRRRGTEPEERIRLRLVARRREILMVGEYGYAIVNDDFETASRRRSRSCGPSGAELPAAKRSRRARSRAPSALHSEAGGTMDNQADVLRSSNIPNKYELIIVAAREARRLNELSRQTGLNVGGKVTNAALEEA